MGEVYDTNTGNGIEAFPSTNWSKLEELKEADESVCQALIDHLISLYWKPVYCYLRKKGFSGHSAADLTQDFFCDIVLEKELFQKADQGRGRLRTFLLTCLKHYTANYYRNKNRQKHHPRHPLLQLDDLEAASNLLKSSEVTPEQAYQISWLQQLLSETVTEVQKWCCQNGQTVHWQLFESQFLMPIMENSPKPSLQSLVERYCLKDEKQAANMLVTSKRIFRRFFCEKLAVSLENPCDLEQELKEILKLFE